MPKCPSCKKENHKNAKFCSFCGSPLKKSTESLLEVLKEQLSPEFVIQKRIAQGGMAKVYIGEQVTLERKIVVKVLHHEFSEDKDMRERMLQEAKTIAKIHHPHIINVITSGLVNNMPYFVMEYAEHGSLVDYLKRKRNIKNFHIQNALAIILKVLKGLAVVHSMGIVHRDIKPENILLHTQEEPVIVDFGIAKVLDSNTQKTKVGLTVGTADYMSPEQCLGIVDIDGRSDIYSVGIMLFEMVTGELPFVGDNSLVVANKHLKEKIPSVSNYLATEKKNLLQEIESSLYGILDSIFQKACSKKRENRFQTAEEFVSILEEFQKAIVGGNHKNFQNIINILPKDQPIKKKTSRLKRVKKKYREESRFKQLLIASLVIVNTIVMYVFIKTCHTPKTEFLDSEIMEK